ncbi:hypothetical protein AB0M46_51350, partial [Dactylosporangium sp. NPDC051485]
TAAAPTTTRAAQRTTAAATDAPYPAETTTTYERPTPTRTTRPPTTAAALAPRGVWEGTATAAVDYYAPCGANFSWIQVGSQSYRQRVQVVASAPVTGETNTFQLSVSTANQTTEGGFTMVSSARTTTGLTLTYWRLTATGGRVSGRLTSTHTAEGVAQNFLYSNKNLDACSNRLGSVLMPLVMDTGTTISGTLGDGSGALTVKGRTGDMLRGFTLTLDLSRTR